MDDKGTDCFGYLSQTLIMIFFTSILSNYLSRALLLSRSILNHHPNAFVYIYVYDYDNFSQYQLASIVELLGNKYCRSVFIKSSRSVLPSPFLFDSRYNIVESCTAVKPFIAKSLLQEADFLVYLDPDTCVYSPLFPADLSLLKEYDFYLTPHCLSSSDNAFLSERLFSRYGIFNLGFFACNPSVSTLKFVDWWCEFVNLYGVDCPSAGLFVDQKPFDFAPIFIDNVLIIKDPGWNMAWWNILSDDRYLDINQTVRYSGIQYPLCFFHFSNLDQDFSHRMLSRGCHYLHSSFNDHLYLMSHPHLYSLFSSYLKDLLLIQSKLDSLQITLNTSRNHRLTKTNLNTVSNTINSELLRLLLYSSDYDSALAYFRSLVPRSLLNRFFLFLRLLIKSGIPLKSHFVYSLRAFFIILLSPTLNDFSSIMKISEFQRSSQ